MASKSENKKQAKLRKKNQKAKRDNQRKSEKRSAFADNHRYPKFVMGDTDNASREFVDAVRSAVDSVDFEYRNLFSYWHRV
jgi:hypothetical protein